MHPIDEMRELHDRLQGFELYALSRLRPLLRKRIGRRVISSVLYSIIDGLMWIGCLFMVMKYLLRYRLPEMLVILGGLGTVIFAQDLGYVAHGHVDHPQGLEYLLSGQFEASELLSELTPFLS